MKSRILSLSMVLIGFLAAGPTGCDCSPCPEPEAFESGNYQIVGLAYGSPRPEDQWLLNTVIGAYLTMDREAGEATIRYTKDGATYEIRYTIED